jgi:putative membrane protein
MLVKISIALVAALHVLFLVLEMFLWKKPFGRKIFGLSREQANQTAALAANQGLYNGFLAAGLCWGLLSGADGKNIVIFFLICVIVAGVFGAFTANRSILWIQA